MGNAARQFYTIDDWAQLPDNERCELIEGDFIYKAMPSSEHADSQTLIAATLVNEFQFKRKGPQGWWIRTEISVVYKGNYNGFIHDLAGWKKENYPEKPRGKRVVERPDWVCEILSGNRKTDLFLKKNVLHQNKVPYYWIVDLEAEAISILEWSEKGYVEIETAFRGEKKQLAPFDMEFDVHILLGHEFS